MPTRDEDEADTGPLSSRLPCAHESRRAIEGGVELLLPALNAGTEAVTSSARVHAVDAGRFGISETIIPGALASIGSIPLATSTCSQRSTPGISSGRPVNVGLVISTSPARKAVCVHVLPCAPTRDGDPAAVPPGSIRSGVTYGTIVSRSANTFALDGSSASAPTVISAPSGGRSSNGNGGRAAAPRPRGRANPGAGPE